MAEQLTKPGVANVSPADAKKLKPLAAHYLAQPHPFTTCVRDQVKHGLSPEHAKRRCAVLLDYFDPARARHSRPATSLAKVEVTDEHRAQARKILELTREPPKRGRLVRALRSAIFGPEIDFAGPSTMERRRAAAKGQAMPARNGGGGRFPIRNESDLRKAIHAVGRATDASGQHTEAERARVRRFIRKRAAALGLTHLIPDSWSSGGSLG